MSLSPITRKPHMSSSLTKSHVSDPHVGVSVCMDAFHKVPAEMRDNLARLNHGQTRLIGGSVDTLYIPGRHRSAFMDVLALFLETDCFLEIATPTTVHLVVPPGEPIQFVDHVRDLSPSLVLSESLLSLVDNVTVVDISASIQCVVREAEMGRRLRSGHVSYLPLGRTR